jgi:hypothetical protein
MHTTMWATGRNLITRAGGTELHHHRPHVMAALRVLGVTFGQLAITWEGAAYRVDGGGLLASTFHAAIAALEETEGLPCLEWLPEAGLSELHLYQEDGELLPLAEVVPSSPASGKLGDVLTWILEKRGVLWFQPRRSRWSGNGDFTLVELIKVLVTNFPTMLVRSYDREEVRMVADPKDHPVTATVSPTGRLYITTSTTHTVQYPEISGHLALESALAQTANPDVSISHVHPHPCLSRKVCLWLAGRRRPHSRRHYKRYVRHAVIQRGQRVEQAKAVQWKETSTLAATGFTLLEWKRIRRVLGLGPWGEQSLYRLKARASHCTMYCTSDWGARMTNVHMKWMWTFITSFGRVRLLDDYAPLFLILGNEWGYKMRRQSFRASAWSSKRSPWPFGN